MIKLKNLNKTYKNFAREPGVWNTVKSLVHRKYEMVEAVKSINLTIEKGEFIGFIGPNGAGKTTTLKMLSGILHPTSGEIIVNGHKPYIRENSFLKKITYMSAQKNQLWWDIPAQDSFLINQVIYEIDKKIFQNRVRELSVMFKVDDLLSVPVRTLSLGERMKLEIICSLLHYPEIIFMDEPTIGLDFVHRQEIRKFLAEYHTENKATIILTSHYFEDISDLCNRLVVINEGSIVVDNSMENIQRDYKDKKIIRMRSNNLDKYRQIYFENIVQDNPGFLDIIADQQMQHDLLNNYQLEQLEIRPVTLEAIIKKHYEISK